jgi:hypothetical protein
MMIVASSPVIALAPLRDQSLVRQAVTSALAAKKLTIAAIKMNAPRVEKSQPTTPVAGTSKNGTITSTIDKPFSLLDHNQLG